MQIPKISQAIDSCAGLIAQQAIRKYYKLHPNNKRWLSPNDMLQEGLIAALQAEGTYDEKLKAKFSTYLYTGLKYGYSKAVDIPLRQKKRSTGAVVELDAPIKKGDSDSDQVANLVSNGEQLPSAVFDAIDGFLGLCDTMSPDAIMTLADGLLCGNWTAAGKGDDKHLGILQEIKETCLDQHVSFDELKFLSTNEEAREIALASLSYLYTIGLGKEVESVYQTNQAKLKILECCRCHGKFDLASIQKGSFLVSSLTCRSCYRELALAEESCFAKEYDPEALECKLHCPDKEVCRTFIQGEAITMAKKPVEEIDEIDDMDFSDIEGEEEKEEVPVKKKKSGAVTVDLSSKKKKAAPVVEIDESEPEDEPEETPDEEEPEPEEEVVVAKKKATKKVAAKKAAAAAPKKAAKKPAAAKKKAAGLEDVYEPTEEWGGRWPCKRGSVMRHCIQRAAQGVKLSELQSEVEKHGNSWPLMLKMLRDGYAGKVRTSHRWELDESGGRLKLTNIKFLLGKKPAKKKAAAAE